MADDELPEDAKRHEVSEDDVKRFTDKLEAWAEDLPANERYLLKNLVARAHDEVAEVAGFTFSFQEPLSPRVTEVLQPKVGSSFGTNMYTTIWEQATGGDDSLRRF